jgi:hypothetical protein
VTARSLLLPPLFTLPLVALPLIAACACGTKVDSDGPSGGEDGSVSSTDARPGRDAAPGQDAAPGPDAAPIEIPENCEGGVITYEVDGEHFLTTLAATASTESLTQAFNALSAGADSWVSVSPDGEYYLTETTRFDSDCDGYSCLALVKSDMSSSEAIKIGGEVVHSDNYGAVASGGNRIVYPLGGGPHDRDLYVSNKSGNSWSSPTLLTASSPHPYNLQPAISADGSKVVFDCGADPYGQPPTSICEVDTNGSNFRVVWTPEQGGIGAQGRSDVALHHPDYFSDGSIVFEADWNGEQIWRLAGNGPPTVIANSYGNDNSPCVLDNQCVVSIWLERPGNTNGTHEIKVMDAAGGNFSMLRIDIDVVDLGTGCGR